MSERYMPFGKISLAAAIFLVGTLLNGCGTSQQELPSKEKIQQQLDRDAEMRAEEDRLEKEAARR